MTRLGLLLAITCCLLPAMATPAQADATTFRSDRTSGVPENDLRMVRVANGDRFLTATFKLRDLRATARSKVELVYTPRSSDYPYVVQLRRTADGEKRTQLWVSDGAHGLTEKVPCAGLKGTWNHRDDKISMKTPQGCFPQNARVSSVKAMAGYWSYTGPGDYTSFRRLARG